MNTTTKREPLFIHINDLGDEYLKPKWLIHGWLEEETIAIVYGQKHVHKSFVVLSWAYHLAKHRRIANFDVSHSIIKSVYIPTEGRNTVRGRHEAFKTGYGELVKGSNDVYIYKNQWDWTDENIEFFCNRLPPKINLVIIDSLSQSIEDGSVNSDEKMRKILSKVQKIRDRCKVAVILVAHSGKDPSKGIMGSSVLGNDVDTEIRVVGGKKPSITLTKQRNGPRDNMKMFFQPIRQFLGKDFNGNNYVNIWLDYSNQANNELNEADKKALEAIKKAQDDDTQRRIQKTSVRKEFDRLYYDHGMVPKKLMKKHQENFNRALTRLHDSQLLKLHGSKHPNIVIELPNEKGEFE